jgi:hypothetical protein
MGCEQPGSYREGDIRKYIFHFNPLKMPRISGEGSWSKALQRDGSPSLAFNNRIRGKHGPSFPFLTKRKNKIY